MKFLITILLSMFTLSGYSQAYTVELLKQPFIYLTDSVSLNKGLTWDEENFRVPLGFEFPLFDKKSDAWFTGFLGSGLTSRNTNDVASGFALISGFGADLTDVNYDLKTEESTPNAGSFISYRIDGSTGDRIAKVEWKNAGLYYDLEKNGKATMFTNHQIWLYEKNGTLEFHYGPSQITDPELVFEDGQSAIVLLSPVIGNNDNNIFPSGGLALTGTPGGFQLRELMPNTSFDSQFEGIFSNGTVLRFTRAGSVSADDFRLQTLVILPNPVQDFFQVKVSGPEGVEHIKSVHVLDLQGKAVAQWSEGTSTYDVSGFQPGVYIIQVRTSAGMSQHKFVKR